MNTRFYRILGVFSVLLIGTLTADISVTEINGNWTNVVGGVNVNGIGTNEIRWGNTDGGPQSGYVFSPAPVIFPVIPNTSFDLGIFTHLNFPVFTAGITEATLTTDYKFLIDGTEVQSSMVYDFQHNETVNSGPGNCCDDIVVAVNNNVFSESFFIDGLEYQLNIKGFRVGNELFTEFSTEENQENSAVLVAEINRVAVPEPSTYLMLATMLAFVVIRKKIWNKVS